ncbi:glutathione S-transferase family protein [Aliikangiella sp. IMCC44359]|uniref:glutathione S-transferase family protein n=1 Tax=Aliikangiella sp. IMCC44359 TaxID=3459125 RepID=UPI00403AE2FE
MVPVIEHNGLIIHDSIAILAWLDRQYPDKPLFGQTNEEAKHIWQLTMESCDYLRNYMSQLLKPIFFGNLTLTKESTPEMIAFRQASDNLHSECAYVEQQLDINSFFIGKKPVQLKPLFFQRYVCSNEESNKNRTSCVLRDLFD